MRLNKFHQVNNYIQLFRKISEGIYLELSNGNQIDKACEYLVLCQQKAIDLGSFIEAEEGEGHITVSYLEEFCETLYNIHEEIQSERGLSAQSAKNRLETIVNKIEKSANEDIKKSRLIVFLPYKASMWDSLESVWKAADEDPDCEAYVIPIPYFDRTKNNALGTMHWEGDLFPDYVPITRFDEFDFQAAHPDMTFIHNPYDYANYVTSVHPAFYSDKIKEWTDCLVYIPYFSTSGTMSDGFRLLPAYLNADYLIIDNEKLLDIFDAQIPREKILVLGSPKFDSVIEKCANPSEPPLEWKRKMDGKIVCFLNLSLKMLLADAERYLEKLVFIIDCFKNNENACLLWRPHPLTESTFDSMRPKYKKIYEDIKNKFIEDDIGIFDTTANIEDTISWSDAYIGDSATSVITLFEKVNKPIFYMTKKIHKDLRKNPYQYNYYDWKGNKYNKCGIVNRDYIFCDFNDERKYKLLMKLPKEYSKDIFLDVIEYQNGKKYVIPIFANYILLIDGNKKVSEIIIDKSRGHARFKNYEITGKYIFLFPIDYSAAIRVNMENSTIDYLDGVRDYNKFVISDITEYAPKWANEDKLYICKADCSEITIIDCENMQMKALETGFKGSYSSVYVEKQSQICWFIPVFGTRVLSFNIATKETKEFDLQIDGLEAVSIDAEKIEKYYFKSAVRVGEEIIFCPYYANKFIKLNKQTGVVTEWKTQFNTAYYEQNKYDLNGYNGLFFESSNDDEFYYYHRPTNQEFRISKKNLEAQEIIYEYDEADLKKALYYQEREKDEVQVYRENFCLTLQDFLNHESWTEQKKHETNYEETNIGNKIYNTLINLKK